MYIIYKDTHHNKLKNTQTLNNITQKYFPGVGI